MAGTPCIGPTCLPDYGNGEAPKECLLFWRESYFSPSYFVRIVPAILEYESDGSTLLIDQGYRFLGSPPDRAIGASDFSVNEDLAPTTSDGTANQWYQKGREDNGMTPSAATPGFSNHGEYTVGAVDCNASDPGRRSAVFPKYGLDDPIGGEPWHWQASIDPTVPLPSLGEAIIMAALDCSDGPGTPTKRRDPVWMHRPPTLYYGTW